MRTVFAALILAALASTGLAAAPAGKPPANAPNAPAAPAVPAVLDEIIPYGPVPGGPDGLSLLGRIKEIDRKNQRVWVVLNSGERQGPTSFPLERVRLIKYDVEGRRAELAAGDLAARYRFALWLLAVELKDEALFDLEAAAGQPGVPAGAYRLLAALQEEKGRLRQALKSWQALLALKPDDAEAAAAVRRLAEKVRNLPADEGAVVAKPDPGNPAPPEAPKLPEEDPKTNLEVRTGWRIQPWGNQAELSLLRDEETGNQFLVVQMPGGGKEDKTAVGLGLPADISKRARLMFSIYNPDKQALPVSIAVITASDFYETQYLWVKQGWNLDMTVDLNAKDFKCRATEWAHKAEIKDKDQVRQVTFLVNIRHKATIYLDHVRFE